MQSSGKTATTRQPVLPNAKSSANASAGAKLTTEEGKKQGGQAYFMDLLKSKKFQDTKKRRSTLMAQEQAANMAAKVQQQMDEGVAGGGRVPEDD